MEELLRAQLLDLCDRHRRALDLSVSAVGQAALGDHTFFRRLRNGDGFNVKTFDRLVLWFASNWPADVEWPEGVERPAAQAEAAE